MYPTGDLVVQKSDGNLKFLSRLNEQVKIRGNRVDILEIEATLKRIPAIVEALVLAQEAENNEKELGAYLKVSQPVEYTLLKQHLQKFLPDYMLPANFYVVEEMPLNVNGKLDRSVKNLKADRITPFGSYVNPSSTLEKLVASAWKQVLNITGVSLYDHFFEVGGNSLKAIELASYFHNKLGIDFPVTLVFEYPTVLDMSRYLHSQEKAPEAAAHQENIQLLKDTIHNLSSHESY